MNCYYYNIFHKKSQFIMAFWVLFIRCTSGSRVIRWSSPYFCNLLKHPWKWVDSLQRSKVFLGEVRTWTFEGLVPQNVWWYHTILNRYRKKIIPYGLSYYHNESWIIPFFVNFYCISSPIAFFKRPHSWSGMTPGFEPQRDDDCCWTQAIPNLNIAIDAIAMNIS